MKIILEIYLCNKYRTDLWTVRFKDFFRLDQKNKGQIRSKKG